jgi:hypothetical protein
MRRTELLITAVVAIAIALPVLAQPPAVLAAVEINQKVPFTDDFDSCTGERVVISGTTHIVGRITEDSAGGQHFGFTRTLQAAQGVGPASGARYVLISPVTRSESVGFTKGAATTFTEQYSERLIRQGSATPGDDLLLHYLARTTINANGDVTASVSNFRVECT